MPVETLLLFILVILAGAYMAWNIGANDVANAMGTSVGSGALNLKQAVLIAAVLEFLGAFFFGSHVSETIQNDLVDSSVFKDPLIVVYGMLAALLASGAWLQIASYYGWPVSTTHSIVGAVVGFGAVVGGIEAIYWENVVYIVTSWILSPFLGGIFSFAIFSYLRSKIFFAPDPVAATKRLAPILAFCVVFILSLIMLYNGLSNVELNMNFFQVITLSALVGLLGSLASKLYLKRIIRPEISQKFSEDYNPEIANQLEKAKKLIQQVQAASKGCLQYQASEILEEIKMLSQAVKQKAESGKESLDYSIVEKIFGYLQICTACLMAFAHGANDVANAIGPLSASINILSTGFVAAQAAVPLWALGLGGVGIVIGLATWGWRVIETIGKKITELTPSRGFSAEFGASVTILLASRLGLPISTTHTLVGSVIGVGLARGLEALDMRTTKNIVISWLVTVPAGAIISIAFFYLLKALL